MSEPPPPPSGPPGPPGPPEPPPAPKPIARIALETGGGGGLKKLLVRRHAGELAIGYKEITVTADGQLREPLTVAPGAIAAAAVDHGAREAREAIGRFPILRRLSATAIIPREEGIEGWLWTSSGGSAYQLIGDEDAAPNVALVFLQPLGADVVERVFEPSYLEELTKRSPLGSPTVFGILMRVAHPEDARRALEKIDVLRPLTDREVPPTQRRHLPTDKPADPKLIGGGESSRAQTSVPPPGMG